MSKQEIDYAIKEAYDKAMFDITQEFIRASMNEWNNPTAEELIEEVNK